MKFTIDYNKDDVQLEALEFTQQEYSDLKLAIENVAGAAVSLVTMFAAHITEENKEQQAVIKAVMDEIYRRLENITQDKHSVAEFPFEEMESEFITWIYGQGYDDPYAFAQEYEDMGLKLDFAVENDEAIVFFSDKDGNRCDIIGEIPVYLFEDEEEIAQARCIEYTCIAALALDKVYGHEDNPVRNAPVDSLEKAIRDRI